MKILRFQELLKFCNLISNIRFIALIMLIIVLRLHFGHVFMGSIASLSIFTIKYNRTL